MFIKAWSKRKGDHKEEQKRPRPEGGSKREGLQSAQGDAAQTGWETHYPSLTLLSGVLLEISLAQPTRSREQESPFFFKGALALFFFIVLGLLYFFLLYWVFIVL